MCETPIAAASNSLACPANEAWHVPPCPSPQVASAQSWTTYIEKIWMQLNACNPAGENLQRFTRVMEWITGTADPPCMILHTVNSQLDAMLDAMFADLGLNPGRRQGVIQGASERGPGHRRFQKQCSLWEDKIDFNMTKDPFDYITSEAHELSQTLAPGLRLTSRDIGTKWRRGDDNHKMIWDAIYRLPGGNQTLERQVLVATACPGTSRHHWGTDVDLFSVDVAHFVAQESSPGTRPRFHREYQWLIENAHKYGFHQPYREERPHAYHTIEESTVTLNTRQPTQIQIPMPRPSPFSPTDHNFNEPWHWSFFPVSRPLYWFIGSRSDEYREKIQSLLENRNNQRHERKKAYEYVIGHFFYYVSCVDTWPYEDR